MNTQESLKNLFYYKDGNLYWKNDNKAKKIKDKIAGDIGSTGYISISKDRKRYLAHRLIYLFHHGYLPKYVDHIDRNKTNNKIENLRPCTLQENSFNRISCKKNTSGFKNVTKHKTTNKWQVHFTISKKCVYVGLFDSLEVANLMAIEYRKKYHKEFECSEITK